MTSRRRSLPLDDKKITLDDEGLRAPDDMAEAIMAIRSFVAGDVMRDGMPQPRFGVLSIKARSTPMYVYDHPALKEVSSTSFTDGVHIFVNADFMRKLMDEEDASNGEKDGVVPLLLHNLTHMILRHHYRFGNFPAEIADIGADLSINAKLRLAYPEMEWVPSLLDVSPGASLPPKEMKCVAKLAEETIMRELLSAHNHLWDSEPDENGESAESGQTEPGPGAERQDGQEGQESGSPGESSQGEGGESDGNAEEAAEDSDAPGSSSGGGSGKPPKDKKSRAARPIDRETIKDLLREMKSGGEEALDGNSASHSVSLEQMAEILEDNNLESTKSVLDIPDSDDSQGLEDKQEQVHLNYIEDIERSGREAGNLAVNERGTQALPADEAAFEAFSLSLALQTDRLRERALAAQSGRAVELGASAHATRRL